MPDEFADFEYDQQRLEASRGVLELAVRQLRAFARCVSGNRAEADELVEDTLMLFLSEDRVLGEAGACFGELLKIFRNTQLRTETFQASNTTPDPEFAALMHFGLPEREVAALCLGAGMTAESAAPMLEITTEDAQRMLEECRARLRVEDIPEWPFMPAPQSGEGSL